MFYKAIRSQFQIMIHKRSFQMCFVLIMAYAMFVTVMAAIQQRGEVITSLYHPALMNGLTADGEYSWFFVRYFPFIVVLPAGFAFFDDKKTGMEVMIRSRMSHKKYYVSKAIAGFFGSFLTFFVPFLLELILNIIIFPKEATKHVTNWSAYSSSYVSQGRRYLFSDLFFDNIYVYYLLHILLVAMLAGCAAVFVLGISTFGVKFKVFLFLPVYLLFYLLSTFYDGKFSTFIDNYLLYCDGGARKVPGFYIGLMIGMVVVGCVCIKLNEKKNELN